MNMNPATNIHRLPAPSALERAAERLGIDNQPDAAQLANLTRLADMLERQMNQAQALSTQDALRQRQPISTSAPVSSAARGITVDARCASVSRAPSPATKLQKTPSTGNATSAAQTSATATMTTAQIVRVLK
jgi:hypothetical protein